MVANLKAVRAGGEPLVGIREMHFLRRIAHTKIAMPGINPGAVASFVFCLLIPDS
jgi:hypothetical protein